jgi:hypothetical protein
MPRGDPMDGVGVIRDADAMPSQLVPKSYRPRAGGPGRRRQRRDALLQLLRPADEGLPEARAGRVVERREDLAAAGVERGQPLALLAIVPLFCQPASDRVERADAGQRLAEAGAEAAGGGDGDPQPGERARPEPDRDQPDRVPAAGCGGAALDLGQQRGRVAGPTVVRRAQQRLVQRLALAPGAGGGVDGRGIEADYDQRRAASRI